MKKLRKQFDVMSLILVEICLLNCISFKNLVQECHLLLFSKSRYSRDKSYLQISSGRRVVANEKIECDHPSVTFLTVCSILKWKVKDSRFFGGAGAKSCTQKTWINFSILRSCHVSNLSKKHFN